MYIACLFKTYQFITQILYIAYSNSNQDLRLGAAGNEAAKKMEINTT